MTKDILQGKWQSIKGKLKQQWGKLTENEIHEMEGSYDELMGIIQQKYGYKKDEAKQELDNFIKNIEK